MSKIRTSVELHPDGCRVVEAEVSPGRGRVPGRDVRVTAFAELGGGADADALTAELSRLRQQRKLARDAWVTLWGLRANQQLLRLPPAQPDSLEALARREARKEIAAFEGEPDGATVSVTLGAEMQVGAHRRREVSLVAASSADVRRRIQPLVDAGFVVRGVVTPAQALAALARARRSTGTTAYVAIVARATCIAIVRDGILLFAREMPWGHEVRDSDPGSRIPDPESVETRLASELKRSILFFKQTFRAPVEAIALCGDMPNMRALTAPLGAALAVPVETLDSLVGIDAAAVPEPAAAFRAQVASLQMAIATAADPAPAANLLPPAIRKVREAHTQMVRLAIATAASLLLVGGWYSIVSQTAGHRRTEIRTIEQQLAILEPDAIRISQLRDAYTLATAQQAALSAFDTQGPRLARLLEVLASSTPDAVVVTAVDIQPDGAAWRASIAGVAMHEDAAVAQRAVNELLEGLAASPFAGSPVQPPARRIVSGRGAAADGNTDTNVSIPAGMVGVEFVADLRLRK